ncbi:MAG: DUF554 domain-containing protein [Sphaerochaetaceae bacterium]|nr:DUF554 domain-containing protein [Sphaerochaetaceae bacterium]
MLATFINALAVIIGALFGLFLGKKITESFKTVVMLSAGVTTLVIGIKMALDAPSSIANLFALIIGGFIGFALKIEDGILSLGDKIEKLTGKGESGGAFAKGFLNSSLLFCTGAMSIVGSIAAGTRGDYELILIKSIMDGFMAVVFASTYGLGVFASALTIVIYQGFFTLFGGVIEPLLGADGIGAMASTGGLLLIFLALNLLSLRDCKTGNFLPALILAPLMQYLYSLLPL